MILTNNLTLKLITNLFILCFFLPDLGQVPGLQQDLMRYWELQKEENKIRHAVQGLAVHLREAGHGQAGVEPAAAGPDHLVMSLSG